MVKAYINYPNPHIMLHWDLTCSSIEQQHKEGQRTIHLDINSLSSELRLFSDKYYHFGADALINDMWLEVDFGDTSFEHAVVEYIRKLLAEHYSPFGRVVIEEHC